ncbi:helix-turn-helix domain-containing protein [Paenibacillus koleovorans]|uniref:helix-turn-helix domain-containing protein n=1 Tax=Paenibacillus koleovorans TaxID=121608 RepID=UPI0013E292ED|nr:helix-turn-helix transcriptional regulator [Paenibacillus koleovorans]
MKVFAEEIRTGDFAEKVGISKSDIRKLHEKSHQNGVQRDSMRVRFRVQGKMLERLIAKNQVLMDVIQKQGLLKKNSFYFPNLLMVTDSNGVILHISGDERSISNAVRMNNIGIGSAMSITSAGTNAISAAIELQRPVWISDEDHYLDTMQDWVTMCVPIHNSENHCVGYLALSAVRHVFAPFLYPCIESIALSMEYELRKSELQTKSWLVEEVLEERLKSFKLTFREKEIAMYWLLDYDYKQIGKVLGISENTVRVYVTKINSKLKVNSKASLILRVLGAI